MFLSIFPSDIFLNDTLIFNMLSATSTFVLGIVILLHDRKKLSNQIAFLTAASLSFWALSSTLTDVVHDGVASLFWARTAIIGAFYFAGLFLTFSYVFPDPARPLPFWKAVLIMLPSLLVSPFVYSNLNVSSVRLMDWGTDFTPGILFYLGLPYAILYLVLAARNFIKVRNATKDKLRHEQVTLVFAASALVILSLVTTNVVLPIAFNYTKAGPFGAAASLIFVLMMSYAIYAKGVMNVKVLATEFFCYLLIFLALNQCLTSDSLNVLARNVITLGAISAFSFMLVRSVRQEVQRRAELLKVTQQLRKANEHLREMDRLKSEFISIASHQLRTPISVIKGYFSLMLEGAYGPVEGALREKIESMNVMNERLVSMVNNMLNVSRIERNKIEYSCRELNLVPMVKEVVAELYNKARQKGVTVLTTLTDESDVSAFVDGEKFQEVVANLIDNAIKYSQKGTITVAASRHGRRKEVMVTVSDEGIGMDPDSAAHTFQKFFRANDPAVVRESGTGLGLYICGIFIRGMGGDIWIEKTAPGKGSVIAFTVPTEPGVQCMPRRRKSE